MKAQIIEKDGHPEFAVIPYADYQHFLELLEDEVDARTVAEFHESYAAGREFMVPEEIVRRELAGGQSQCCGSCGEHECRTVSISDQRYEVIPERTRVESRPNGRSRTDYPAK